MTKDTVISARQLSKHVTVKKARVDAVHELDLDVTRGELVAFLGPNGAGKTTSLRMLTTLLPPSTGTATVAGHDIRTDPAGVRRRIGYIGQGNSAGHNQRVRDELLSQGAFYGMTRAATVRRADELLDSLDLASLEQRLKGTSAIGVLSKIALKNQVDDLLGQFRAFYQGKVKTTLAELRRPYDLLVLKVLSLLQDSDPSLASAIVASREAIWGILADPKKFATVA